MSRNEQKIRQAAESIGKKVHSIRWEPLGPSFEMMGRSGGWIVNDEAIGHNTDEAVEFILRYWDDRDFRRLRGIGIGHQKVTANVEISDNDSSRS